MQKNTVKVQDSEIEIYLTQIQYFLDSYCEQWQIDAHELSQSRWNACLHYIYENVFENTNLLRTEPYIDLSMESGRRANFQHTNANSYDQEKVEIVLDIYINLCQEMEKEISAFGFSQLVGINRNTFREWDAKQDITPGRCSILKKLKEAQEESLSNKLLSSKGSPVGTLAILNHRFNWNTASISIDDTKQQQSITEIQERYLPADAEQVEQALPGDSQEEIQELSFD